MTYYFCMKSNATWVYCNCNSVSPLDYSFPALMINYSDYELPDRQEPELSHLEAMHSQPAQSFFLGFQNSQELGRKDWEACYESHLLHFVFAETLESSLQVPALSQERRREGQLYVEPEQVKRGTFKQVKEQKNETKNIPKNFGKGIITFIQKNQKKLRVLLRNQGLSFNFFMTSIRAQKKTINTISDLRRLWTHQIFGRSMRIISNLFFRRYALDYIFNSRIHNYASHIKYRQSLWQALRNPDHFDRIKEF